MTEKTACLIIHGFGGNVGEVGTLRDYLSDKGFFVVCSTLKGHTGIKRDMAGVHYSEWINSAEKDLICLIPRFERVIVIGFSMGGLIAANLALKHRVSGIATLSAPIYYWDIKRIFANIINNLKTRNYVNIQYYTKSAFTIPLSALINFRVLLYRSKPIFRQITCPIFVAQGMMDDTVQHRSAEYIFNSAASSVKRKKYYQNANHLICHSSDKEALFEDIFRFINQV